MHIRTVLAVSALAIVAATGCGKRHKAVIPAGPPAAYAGSYTQSCHDIVSLDGGYISAACADTKSRYDLSYIQASLCKGDIGNNDGLLVCNGAIGTTTPPPPAASSQAGG